jgi:DNA-binding MarR family transcriptional regulator
MDEHLIHPVRLSVVAALSRVERAEFGLVRDTLEVTDSMLSKQVALLEDVGYLEVSKGRIGRRPRTWLALTRRGDRAYVEHLDALRAIAELALGR